MMLQQSTQPQQQPMPPPQSQPMAVPLPMVIGHDGIPRLQSADAHRLPFATGVQEGGVYRPPDGTFLPPDATSTPMAQQHQHAGGNKPSNPSSDPIFNLIQQNPSLVIKAGSPSQSAALTHLMSHAQVTNAVVSVAATASNARIPSPLSRSMWRIKS